LRESPFIREHSFVKLGARAVVDRRLPRLAAKPSRGIARCGCLERMDLC
jgi:hypothetical protein